MNIFLYTILFIIGTIIGYYCALTAIEIPKKLDLRKTHYSKNSNEKLVSNLTYTLIGGVSSVVLANTLKINANNYDISSIVIYFFAMIYISVLTLIGGIDRNYSKISKSVLAFGVVSSILYMIYLFAIDLSSVYLNIKYLIIYMVLLIIDAFLLRKFAKDSYIINLLILITIISVYSNFTILIYTLLLSLVATILYILILKSQQRKNGNKKLDIAKTPVGFFIASSNIIVLFMIRIFENYL